MKIRLGEIPEEGRSYVWNTQTGEISHVLEDLIQDQVYQTDFFIRPINSKDFELSGKIATRTTDLCSRCGIDILFPIKANFREILIPPQPEDRTGKYTKVNHVSEINEDGPHSTEYGSNQSFDMGEYLHEIVALCIPFNPAPPPDEKGNCSDCGISVPAEVFKYDEKIEPDVNSNPFDSLKNLKLQ